MALRGGYLDHPGTTKLTIFLMGGSVYGSIEGADGRVSNVLSASSYDLDWNLSCTSVSKNGYEAC
ncbi:hypothetical protein FRC17_003970 [Serendipita sp. 399]|nr:hypothetical protein FRC17_003970 [Serendipita sp. 399]